MSEGKSHTTTNGVSQEEGGGGGGCGESSIMLEHQRKLPRLPIPELKDTLEKFCKESVSALLLSKKEHEELEKCVEEFLCDDEKLQPLLQEYTKTHGSFVEEFWSEAYLAPDTSVVLNLNPFFLLQRSGEMSQIQRAASLVCCTCKLAVMIQDERLTPDRFKNVPLCMDQFKALFGSCRIPKLHSQDVVEVSPHSQHIVVLYQHQMYCIHVLTTNANTGQLAVCVQEEDVQLMLQEIVDDGKKTPAHISIQSALGVLTTLPRKQWADTRDILIKVSNRNRNALEIIDSALFILCLDTLTPANIHEAAANMLHGTTRLVQKTTTTPPTSKQTQTSNNTHPNNSSKSEQEDHVLFYQGGTCCNRWYDKLQIIVTADGNAGINFEHSAMDGHTALRMASDVYAESVVQLAQSILTLSSIRIPSVLTAPFHPFEFSVKKLQLDLTPPLQQCIFHAETALSDQIVANDTHVLEYTSYGKSFIISHSLSPDSFVQISILLAYYRLYGKIVSQYEPVLTKQFYHGRTEAMRTATKPAVEFCHLFIGNSPKATKFEALKKATRHHSKLVRECAQGQGVERHLFALSCIADKFCPENKPKFFDSIAWKRLNHTILSTSNCGNPALRLFGFGPVVPDGYGIGYIIKDDSLSYSIASKHRQTQRFSNMLQTTLDDLQQLLLSCSNSTRPTKPTIKSSYSVSKGLSLKRQASEREYLDGMDFYGETTATLPPPKQRNTPCRGGGENDFFVGRTYQRKSSDIEFQSLRDIIDELQEDGNNKPS